MNEVDALLRPAPPSIQRYSGNPILSKDQVPYPSVLVYNCGVTKFQGQYVMLFRCDSDYDPRMTWHKFHNIQIGFATSSDGVHWNVDPKPRLEFLKDGENIWA